MSLAKRVCFEDGLSVCPSSQLFSANNELLDKTVTNPFSEFPGYFCNFFTTKIKQILKDVDLISVYHHPLYVMLVINCVSCNLWWRKTSNRLPKLLF